MYDSARTNGESSALWYRQLASNDERALTASAGSWPAHSLDLIVIGGGMAGLSTAYHACKRGLSVAVFERGDLGSGETGRTSAHLSNALDDRYYELERMHGEHGAQLAAASHLAAIEDIERIVRAEAIACEFRRVPGYLFSAKPGDEGARELERELAAARRAGLDVEREASPTPAFPGATCLRFDGQAQFQPLAYIAGLARAIAAMGGRIFTRTRVADLDAHRLRPSVTLDDGRTLSANAIVVATNSPMHERFVMHTKQAAYRSYVITFSIPKDSIPHALFWDTADPYHYVRVSDDGQTLIVGGEDHRVGQSSTPERSWQALETWTRARFPMAAQSRERWSGQILEPADGLAFIGRNPVGASPVYLATGDSGNGLTHGAIAGLLLNDLIAGRSNPWAHLYDPSRKRRPLATREFLQENANTALQYGHWLLPRASSARIEPGQGRVVRHGLRPLAVYVDEHGERHERSAICPHLAGIVVWNRAERSWDCPCHGSRFDPYGKVMCGPARSDLAAVTAEEQVRDAPAAKRSLRFRLGTRLAR